MTSQALGRRDLKEVTYLLSRSLAIALGIASILIILQVPLKWVMFWLIGPTADVAPFASTYFDIVIWGAPASLALFALSGWCVGMQNTRIPMMVSIMQNIVNILVSLTLVYGLDMKIEGVALGTVIAQYAGCLMAVLLIQHSYGRLRAYWRLKGTFLRQPMMQFFSINRDIFLRTLCLVAVNLYFTSAGARYGAVILSVNTVLLQLYLLFSYFMDGFAYAGEALGGRYYGAKNYKELRQMIRHLFGWALAMTITYTLLYIIGGKWIVGILTDEPHVLETAVDYLPWAWFIPAAGAAAFIWDGLFIGFTATRGMLTSSFIAALIFFCTYLLTVNLLGNHGLWLAQILYLSTRGIVQTIWYHFITTCTNQDSTSARS
jgi:MATE family multidrug resistance protein